MSTIMPEGDGIRKALRWIDESRRDNPVKTLIKLIDEAGMRFNLSPNDTDFLVRFYLKKE